MSDVHPSDSSSRLVRAEAPSERTRVRRRANRGVYDRDAIRAILDEAFVCTVAFSSEGEPVAIPTVYGRDGDSLVLHGAVANRMLGCLAEGAPMCVSVTLLDGLVLARSAFHHSVNYRSVVIYGAAAEVADPQEKLAALRAVVEHVYPGRSDEVRPPNTSELAATRVLRVPIDEASAKVRALPVIDDEDDLGRSCWAGVVPLRLQTGTPEADAALAPDVALPSYLKPWLRPGGVR